MWRLNYWFVKLVVLFRKKKEALKPAPVCFTMGKTNCDYNNIGEALQLLKQKSIEQDICFLFKKEDTNGI